MKQTLLTFKSGLLTKLLLSFTLLLAGLGNIWAVETLTINNTSPTGQYSIPFYASGNINSADLYACGQFIIPASSISAINGGQISKLKFYINSGSTFNGAEFDIYVKEINTTTFSSLDFIDWNTMTSVYSGGLTISSSELEITFSSPFAYSGNNLLIGFKHTKAASKSSSISWYVESTSSNTAIYTKNYGTPRVNAYSQYLPKITFTYIPPVTETLSISPNEDADFGNVINDASKDYTITNNTGAPVTVVPSITGTNYDMFIVSPSGEQTIEDGKSIDFTVTFDWEADLARFGDKSATITFTPNNGDDPFVIEASATAGAELTLDEENTTTITSGTKSVLVKYTPKNGWNTICLPFVLYRNTEPQLDYVTPIFGEDWKAYSFSGYEDGVLTFAETSSTLGSNYPYLIYVESAAIHTNGVLFGSVDVNRTSAPSKPANDVTFQGTYAPKAKGTLEGCYGVTGDGHIAKGGSGAYMKGYRAYFTGITDSGVKMMILDADDETDLGFVKMVDENAKDVYTLTGQKVQKGRKGIYIVNGKKVVIK